MYGITCCVWHHNVSNSLDGAPVVFLETYFSRDAFHNSSWPIWMTFFIMWHTHDTHLQLYDKFSPDTSPGFLISFLERTFFHGTLQLCSHKFNLLLDIWWINFVLQHFLICVLFGLLFLFCKYTLLIETI